MSRIQAVLWDIDGTFIDSEPLHAESLQYASHSAGATPDFIRAGHHLGSSAQDVFQQMCAAYPITITFRKWSQLRTDYYLKSVANLAIRGDALRVYQELQQRDIPQAFVSNSNKIIVMANLSAMGLSDPELVTVSRNDVRLGKPSPEPYQRAAYLLGVDSKNCIALEDSTTGCQSGLAAGCKTLLWPEQGVEIPDGAILIQDIREVLDHLEHKT